MKKALVSIVIAGALFGCGSEGGTTGSAGSSAPASTGASTGAKPTPAKPTPAKDAAPELKTVEDDKMGYKVQVPKDAEVKKESDTFHKYNLGMPVDFSVAIQMMTDSDLTAYKSIDEFLKNEQPRFPKEAISKKELGKDRYLIVFPDVGLHGQKVEANLWYVKDKKRFWVRCSALEPNLELATTMCTSFEAK